MSRADLPTPQQMRMLRQLRQTIIKSIEASGSTTTTADGNVISIGHQDDPDQRWRAVGTAMNAVAYVSGLSQAEFMELAAAAYQLKIDENDPEIK